MSAHRTSPIWEIAPDELKTLVQNSNSYTQALKHFGLENKGENFRTLRKRMQEENINFSHFLSKKESLVPYKNSYGSIEEILIVNSSFNRSHLKTKLLKEKLLEYVCVMCGQLPEWNGKPLTLQLDHINGISNDNRLENLRILCPHCHSQTDNFAGKNKKLRK